jgi:hypothetical protein
MNGVKAYSAMSKEDWVTLKLRKELIYEIDRVIDSPKSRYFGMKRYDSRTDFATAACIKLLEQEAKGHLVEVSAKQ